jgi:hypothetical protein
MWLTYVVIQLIVRFVTSTYATQGSMAFFQMVTRLSSVMLSFNVLFTVLNTRARYTYLIYFGILVVHACLAWNNYTKFNIIKMYQIFTKPVVALMENLNTLWIVIMFTWECVPPIVVLNLLLGPV